MTHRRVTEMRAGREGRGVEKNPVTGGECSTPGLWPPPLSVDHFFFFSG